MPAHPPTIMCHRVFPLSVSFHPKSLVHQSCILVFQPTTSNFFFHLFSASHRVRVCVHHLFIFGAPYFFKLSSLFYFSQFFSRVFFYRLFLFFRSFRLSFIFNVFSPVGEPFTQRPSYNVRPFYHDGETINNVIPACFSPAPGHTVCPSSTTTNKKKPLSSSD